MFKVKSVVIYKSKTGFVSKYAQWLAEALPADLFELSQANPDMLEEYDAVVYGGSLHAVGIIGIDFIKNNIDRMKGKKVTVFAVGASPPGEEVIKEIIDSNIPREQQDQIKFFYLRGGFNYKKLPIGDKLLMSLLKIKIKRKKKQGKALSRDEKGMLAAYDKPVDFTKKEYIDAIVEHVNS